jgi:uncharacterized membrane protein
MPIVETLSQLAEPWAHAYDNSKLLMNGVTFAHVGGFLAAGGLALSADRSVFRALAGSDEDRRVHLAGLHAVHTPVLAGLAVTFLSGLLLFLADVKTFATAPVFWVKMGFLVLLLANGAALRAAGRRLTGDEAVEAWRSLRTYALFSSLLWFLAVLTGVMLVNL